MHSFGLGIVPDYEPAVKWYYLAAKQGHALAQYNLGRLYYLGQGVSENMIYAHMWTKQASSNGIVMGRELNELLSELMTSTQIEEAHRLEKECVAKNYNGC
jgi:TPR repeat protein